MSMDIKPIPYELLVHSATVLGAESEDDWGNPVPGDITQLEHVRFEPSSAIKQSTNDSSIDYQSLLFIDTAQSKPKGFKPEKEMAIEFAGHKMYVEKVDPVYAVDPISPHHYEVYLT